MQSQDFYLFIVFFHIFLFRLQEKQVKEQQIEHAKKILSIQDLMKENLAKVRY